MPYKSKAQRAYMHIHHPKIAKKWDKKYGSKIVKGRKKKKQKGLKMDTKDERYDEAVNALNKYYKDHDFENLGYELWQPNLSKTQYTDSCVYLYGPKKQYAKYCDTDGVKAIIEYSAPPAPQIDDPVTRTGDLGSRSGREAEPKIIKQKRIEKPKKIAKRQKKK